jgi:hypothetical protein
LRPVFLSIWYLSLLMYDWWACAGTVHGIRNYELMLLLLMQWGFLELSKGCKKTQLVIQIPLMGKNRI